jgi:ubiquinone/menaquinone biosynthesis C-methylase UbiE
MQAAVVRSADEIRDVNARYHDITAAGYDTKWGIDFGELGQGQVLGKLRKLIDPAITSAGLGGALEIGAGTGYFGLNLLRAGVIEALTCVDISPGMLATLAENAARLGVDAGTVVADAEALPFEDESFDLIFGHAVLHHLPHLDRAFAEIHRVLRPGGRIVFAGEPSRLGDRLARLPKRAAAIAAPAWRALIGASAAPANGSAHPHPTEHDLEYEVDIHTFAPQDLTELAREAGFAEVDVEGEELTANCFGWFNRGLEASARPHDIPAWWRNYAFQGYLTLQRLDAKVLEPRLPAALFYNLLLTARRP